MCPKTNLRNDGSAFANDCSSRRVSHLLARLCTINPEYAEADSHLALLRNGIETLKRRYVSAIALKELTTSSGPFSVKKLS